MGLTVARAPCATGTGPFLAIQSVANAIAAALNLITLYEECQLPFRLLE